MTTTAGGKRRQRGTGKAAKADAGLRSAQHSEAGAAKPKTTRFRMIGQTVCIHCPREEWSELKGRYATVVNQWGDGSVCVEVERWQGSKARICFARHEVEHVPLNDYMRRNANEECALIVRAVDLGSYTGPYLPEHGWISDKVRATLLRRAARLKDHIRVIQRLNQQSLPKIARHVEHGIGNYCTAIVPYAGGAQ